MTAPDTIIIVHPRERRAKCTVQPLRNKPGFVFYKHPRMPQSLDGYVRLGMGGPTLGPADADSGLLVLDGTWRWVEPMERLAASIPLRSLPPLATAYPRSSKVMDDPDGGLATIEAIYAAYRLLGRDTSLLFEHYHWGQQFIQQNAGVWESAPSGCSADSAGGCSTYSQCARCGASFECGAVCGSARCWCMDLPHVVPLDSATDCLCPNCLRSEIESRSGKNDVAKSGPAMPES